MKKLLALLMAAALCLSADHKTTENIKARGAFTVNIADAAHVAECELTEHRSPHRPSSPRPP